MRNRILRLLHVLCEMTDGTPNGTPPSGDDARERRKRAYEIRSAVGIAVFVLTCSWLQLTRYGMDSWMFVVLFNINLILMLVAFGLVARNVIKLLMDRRNKVFGATLRTRMVLTFFFLTLIPTLVLFLASNKIISTGMDYVFAIQLHGRFANIPDVDEIKISMRLIISVLSLFTLFAAIWFGFRLSKELTAPLLALSEGTVRLAKGELDFIIADSGNDELTQLVRSFNKMAADLRDGQAKLTKANELLSMHNAAMDERRKYIEAILDNITTGVITLDGAGRLQTINKAACATFRITADFLYGRTPETFLPPAYAPAFFDMLDTLREDPSECWHRQVDFVAKGRTWKLAVNAVALTDDRGEIRTFIVAIEDITELEKMQRMAVWREVARRIAHEIKNPLTPIKLSAQRLAKKFGSGVDDPAFEQCTSLIVNQSDRLQKMVSEFSAFAKLPEVHLRLADLRPIIDEMAAIFAEAHPDIAWRADVDAALPQLMIDKSAMHCVLLNLLNNAADAINSMENPARKAVTLSAHTIDGGNFVRISVADTGPGLTPEEHDRMFEPYFSHKKDGTGLGLAIVKSVIADHHGEITVDSDDSGTTIGITLPIFDHLVQGEA